MNSEQRHELRYQRRKAKRDAKKQAFLNSLPSYDEIFTYKNLYNAMKECCKGVMWKTSIINYKTYGVDRIAELQDFLHRRTYRSRGFTYFTICERGKVRHIRSVHISERTVQRCFCDNYLVPLLSHYLIYDNGASIKHKGTDFTIRRFKAHLQKYARRHSNEGYVVFFDFKGYFDNISHEALYNVIDPYLVDEDCRNLFHHFVDNFGELGLGLGSQVSQIAAVMFPSMLDTAIKHKFKYYGRYMDDGYVLCADRSEVTAVIQTLKLVAGTLKIIIIDSKIRICKLRHTITWLKKRVNLTSTGKVTIRLANKTMYQALRRMRKLHRMGMNKLDAFNTLKARLGTYSHISCTRFIIKLKKEFQRLYINKVVAEPYIYA